MTVCPGAEPALTRCLDDHLHSKTGHFHWGVTLNVTKKVVLVNICMILKPVFSSDQALLRVSCSIFPVRTL